jgi:hypothetical protein
LNTSIVRTIASFIALSALTACAGNQPTAPAQPNTAAESQAALQPIAALGSDAVIADVGNGQKTPAAISFRLNLGDLSAYQVKASTPGVAAKTLADMTHVKFYLIASDTGTPPTALSGTGFGYSVTATNRTNGFVDVTFSNVAANDTGKAYYVVAAAFSSATLTAANNITNLDAPINDVTEGKYFASTTGGSPAGEVRVTPVTYAISGTNALGVPLQLLDAVSPVIESSVNVTVGDEITGAPSGSAN